MYCVVISRCKGDYRVTRNLIQAFVGSTGSRAKKKKNSFTDRKLLWRDVKK